MIVVPDDDSVATVFLTFVKGLVGKLDALFGTLAAVELGNAKSNRHLDFLSAKEHRLVFNLLAEALCNMGGVVQFRFRKERQELFATVTGEHVVLAQQAADGACDGLEHGIASGMTVSIVHVLEVVDVDKDNAEVLSQTACAVDFFFNRLVHVATVRQLREFVGSRNDVELLVSLFEFVGTFLDFSFKLFSMVVEFLNLPLDHLVHLVEYLGESADFVLTTLGVELFDVQVTFGNLRNVVNQVVKRLTHDKDLPQRHEQDGDDGTVEDDLSDMLDGRN